MKLSSRSPKDSTIAGQQTWKLFSEFLEAQRKFNNLETIQQLDLNTKVIGLNRAHIQAMKVSSGQEAMDLLLQSERYI